MRDIDLTRAIAARKTAWITTHLATMNGLCIMVESCR